MPATETAKSLDDPEFKAELQRLRRTDNLTNWYYLARTYLYLAAVIAGAVWVFEPFRLGAMPLQFVALLFPVWALGWLPWRAIDPADGPDPRLTRLVMVPVTSLVLFVVTWYVILAANIWGFASAIRWSTVVTFAGPTGLLVILAGTTRLRTRWHA